jgi:hypothetical protein
MKCTKTDTAYTDEELISLLSLDEAEAIKGIYGKYWEALLD